MSFHHLDQFAARPSPVTAAPPVAGLDSAVTVALGAALLPADAWAGFAALATLVAGLALMARVPLPLVARRAVWPLLLLALASAFLLVLVPGTAIARWGPVTVTDAGMLRFEAVLARGAVALGAAVLLVSTTTFPDLLRALRQARLPSAITVALGLAYRLLYILVDERERMERAARSRNAGGGAARRRALLTRIAAALVGRAFARGERTHRAMLARGFTGDFRPLDPTPWSPTAGMGLIGLVLVVAAVVALARYAR